MILLYITYMLFYGISTVSFALLLFKLNFSYATLIVGFALLAYVTKVVGEYILIKERNAMFEEMQAATLKKEEKKVVNE